MTKKLVLAVGTAAVFSILAGCTAYDRATSYVNEPVVEFESLSFRQISRLSSVGRATDL